MVRLTLFCAYVCVANRRGGMSLCASSARANLALCQRARKELSLLEPLVRTKLRFEVRIQ